MAGSRICFWGVFPEGARFGGATADFACHAAVLGCHVAMVSAVGNDQGGREDVEILRSYGIDRTIELESVTKAYRIDSGSRTKTVDPSQED
jgi:sugar/nucleoside kinase (ribokinase family)